MERRRERWGMLMKGDDSWSAVMCLLCLLELEMLMMESVGRPSR
jgi:hypothetical protein